MDFYRIIACRSNQGNDWRVIFNSYCFKDSAINKAKEIFLTDEWSNVAVELDNESPICTSVIWDAGHDKISNFSWD